MGRTTAYSASPPTTGRLACGNSSWARNPSGQLPTLWGNWLTPKWRAGTKDTGLICLGQLPLPQLQGSPAGESENANRSNREAAGFGSSEDRGAGKRRAVATDEQTLDFRSAHGE